jgi:hypothetical protein
MKHDRSKRWIWPPLNHWILFWGAWIALLTTVLGSRLLDWFTKLTGASALWLFYSAALASACVGIALIFYAKLPLYRAGRYFTFGSRAIPENRRAFYSWGYWLAILGAAILALLSL